MVLEVAEQGGFGWGKSFGHARSRGRRPVYQPEGCDASPHTGGASVTLSAGEPTLKRATVPRPRHAPRLGGVARIARRSS
jgi:hypothetical protein